MRKSSTARGYGARWQRLREAVLRRDKYKCVHCQLEGRTARASEVDHIIRKADGGTNHPSNLQSLCGSCHQAKTRRENGGKDMACDANGIPLKPNPYWGGGGSVSSA